MEKMFTILKDAKDYRGQIGFIHTNDVANNDPPTFRINATIGDLQFANICEHKF